VEEVILFIKVANYPYPTKKDNYQSVAYAQELQFSKFDVLLDNIRNLYS
jgi:hypothetical protein